jgi:hypothetical protein
VTSLDEGDFEVVEPDPGSLIESLRSFGYSLETAVADLVDNSITAGAGKVEVDFHWAGDDSWISILDNGSGIAPEMLSDVMRPGSSNPLDDRDENDLGRFGLGLKTASFSQGRSLTVATRTSDAALACRRWDLDHVQRTRQWQLLKAPRSESMERIAAIEKADHGTLVLWEHLDRVVGSDTADADSRHFFEAAERVERHLAAVFHRFLTKTGLKIRLNGNLINPWDPFCAAHEATQQLPGEDLRCGGGLVHVQPYVLPHHSKFKDTRDHVAAGGIKGWNAQQGFYLYRANRLILSGGWMVGGLKPEEHHKLGRVSIEIDQTMDGDWDIDVRKSRARPPAGLTDDLVRIARTTRKSASNVYRHRGSNLAKLVGERPITPTWKARKQGGEFRYTVNRKHPLVKQAEDNAVDRVTSVRALIDLVERTLPVQQIAYDAFRDGASQVDPGASSMSSELIEAAREFVAKLVAGGVGKDEAKASLLAIEPFSHHPGVVEEIQ